MDDVIVKTRGQLLRCRHNLIEEVGDSGGLPVLHLGSVVECGAGSTVIAGKRSARKSASKDFKQSRGTVVVVYFETTIDDRPRLVELGVQLSPGFGWFLPADLTLTSNSQEVPNAS